MSTIEKQQVTVETTVKAPIAKVWDYWSAPEHIIKWSAASEDWHTPRAENDLRAGGKFSSRMEAKDGSFGFDFGGTYDEVITHELISYTMADGRQVSIKFNNDGDSTGIVETFDTETQNSVEMQQQGWQAILDNFRKYTESK